MLIGWKPSAFEIIRGPEKSEIDIDWPDHVPIPQVGDELIYRGSTVTIVDRAYSGGSVEKETITDLKLTLIWRDRRLEQNPLVRDRELPLGSRPQLFEG